MRGARTLSSVCRRAGWRAASSSSKPTFPQEEPAGLPCSHPASLPNVAETLAATRTPGHTQGSAVSAGDMAGNPNCSRFSCTPGQSSLETRAGLPGQQCHLWFSLISSARKAPFCCQTLNFLVCVFALIFVISSPPSFLVTAVPFYLASSLCVSLL